MIAERLAILLYEDQHGPTKQFGLHKFIMRCVCDECGVAPEQQYKVFGSVEERPMKGDSKVLRALWNDLPNIAAKGEMVIAILDNDKIREALGLAKQAPDDKVCETILAKCAGPVHIVLLKENTESILRAARECGGVNDTDLFERAVTAKEPPARDIIFGNISKLAAKNIRDCIRDKIGSLGPLINRVATSLAPVVALAAGTQ
jgi:hypothetical protein